MTRHCMFSEMFGFLLCFGILLVITSETLVARSLGNGFWNELSLYCAILGSVRVLTWKTNYV